MTRLTQECPRHPTALRCAHFGERSIAILEKDTRGYQVLTQGDGFGVSHYWQGPREEVFRMFNDLERDWLRGVWR